MLTVRRLEAADAATAGRWDAFVQACPEATFFHRAGWQRIMLRVFRHPAHFLYAEDDGGLRGVLPLAQVKSRLFGNALVSLPFAVYGGAATDGDPAVLAALEAEAERLALHLGVEHLELRNLRPRHTDWPRQDLYVTFRKEILPDEAANLAAIPRKQRAMVRKGIERGLTGAVDDTADRFFPLYADNVHRHGTPALGRRYFDALLAEFGRDCRILTVCDAAGRPVSSVLSFYFRDEVLPYYAGDVDRARALAANDFKYWELLRRSCAEGLRIFDFGRSKRDTGSFAFKKNWGCAPEPLHYEYRLYRRAGIPQNNPANAKYRLLIAAWRRLPVWLANRLGPPIVRNLG
jgi:FemAB-related protein (PEP-CTERM system-associated)